MAPSTMKYKTKVTITTETRTSISSPFGNAIKNLPPIQPKPRRIVSVSRQPVMEKASSISPKILSHVSSSRAQPARVQKPTKSTASLRNAKSPNDMLHLEDSEEQLEIAEAKLKLSRAKKAKQSRVRAPKTALKQTVREEKTRAKSLDSSVHSNTKRTPKRRHDEVDKDDTDSAAPLATNKQTRAKRPRIYEDYDEENSSDSDMPPTTPQHKGAKRVRRSTEDNTGEDMRPLKRVKPKPSEELEAGAPASQDAKEVNADSSSRKPLKPKSAMAMKSSQDFKNKRENKLAGELKEKQAKQQAHGQTARATGASAEGLRKSTSRAKQYAHAETTRHPVDPAKGLQKAKDVPNPKAAPPKPRRRVQQKAPGLADWMAIAEKAQGIVKL